MSFSALLKPEDSLPEPTDDLICPLTLSLFKDPVVASDGFTYEREVIRRWQKDKGTSPLTREKLSTTFLPNRDMISRVHLFNDRISSPFSFPANFPNDNGLFLVNTKAITRVSKYVESSLGNLGGQYTVSHIERNVNSSWKKFAAKRVEMQHGGIVNEVYLFHGTTTDTNISSIFREGFHKDKSKGGPCGFGCYFSESVSYCIETQKVTWTTLDKSKGKVVLSRVLLGVCRPGKETFQDAPSGAHSSFCRGTGGRIFCLYDTDQLYPEFVVHLSKHTGGAAYNEAAEQILSVGCVDQFGGTVVPHEAVVNPLILLKDSPSHPCTFSDGNVIVKGILLGRCIKQIEKLAIKDETGKVHFLPDTGVTLNDTLPIALPWKSKGLVFRSQCSKVLMKFLNNTVEGLRSYATTVEPTFLNLLIEYRMYNVCVLLLGGAVRHSIQGNLSGLKDVDVCFGASPEDMVKIGFRFNPITVHRLLVTWGKGHCIMEGKPIQACCVSEEQTVDRIARVISTDLCENIITFDFACNCIFFDPIEEIYIDLTGCGAFDILNKLLRITVSYNLWDVWFAHNTLKAFRYWKMRLLGYRPVDIPTHDYLVRQTIRTLIEGDEKTNKKKALAFWKVLGYEKEKLVCMVATFQRLFLADLEEAKGRGVIDCNVNEIWKLLGEALTVDPQQ